MKKTMKTVFNRLLAKKPENYLYAEWDKSNFKIPDELKLSETSSLGDALYVFFTKQVDMTFLELLTQTNMHQTGWTLLEIFILPLKMVCISKVTVIFTSHYRMKYAVN